MAKPWTHVGWQLMYNEEQPSAAGASGAAENWATVPLNAAAVSRVACV